MALYLITYDLHRDRNYQPVYELMAEWKAERLLESIWLAQLRGPAETIRDIVLNAIDSDDSVAVVRLKAGSDWATIRTQRGGTDWLKRNLPTAF